MIGSRLTEIGPVPLGPSAKIEAQEVGAVPWRGRTVNALRQSTIMAEPDQWATLTFGELLQVPGMGPIGVLDFACSLEGRLPPSNAGDPERAPEKAGVQVTDLEAALLEDWSEQVSAEDPRFAALLPPGKGTFAERVLKLLTDGTADTEEVHAYRMALPAIQAKVRELESVGLEDALRGFLTALVGIGDHRLDPLLARLNWDGRPEPLTLEKAGRLAGVTRERMRQLEQKVRERLPSHQVFMPALARAMSMLAAIAPTSTERAAQDLANAKISAGPFDAASALATAEDLHHPTAVSIETIRDVRTIVRESFGEIGLSVAKIASRLAATSGAISVTRVVAWHSQTSTEPVTVDRVRRILDLYCSPLYLDTESEWFRIPSLSNDAIRDLTRKILSVTSEVDILSIREGIKRVFRLRNSSVPTYQRWRPTAPPKAILERYFSGHPEFVLTKDGTVRSVVPLDSESELPGIERAVVAVLRASPNQILHRQELLAECATRGIRSNTATAVLTYSCVIHNLGNGFWTVRGARVDPVTLESLMAGRPEGRAKRVIDHGWTPDGLLWLAVRAPDLVTHPHPILGLPSAIRRYIDRSQYPARTEEGVDCGTIRVYDGHSTAGYATFLRMSGADDDDVLLLRFDLASGTVTLSLADQEQLDQMILGESSE